MSEKLEECLALTDGSRFFRGDLHIHSYKGSHDVTDSTMTPAEIVNVAAREHLAIIAIADHNEISNVNEAVNAGQKQNVLVVPAVELSTPEGHLLCYFPTPSQLAKFYSKLDIADQWQPNSRCQTAMLRCLDLAQEHEGFCILAHIDAGNGLETNHPGGSPHKIDIICHKALLGIELASAKSPVHFSKVDADQTRRHIARQRIEKLGLGEDQYLARILNSDSHSLNALGRNANHDRKLTRYKMMAPSFEGLKLSLMEGDSRIRLEDEVPVTVPYILGVCFSGGFLDNQSIHFNSNLNCIIGGRGSGKSTTFEALHCLTGNTSQSDVVDSEVWPAQLYLFWKDEADVTHTLHRPINGTLYNHDSEDGPLAFEIVCFGQGEASRVREESKTDPLALMRYLDTFCDIGGLIEQEDFAIAELHEKHQEIVKALKQANALPDKQREYEVVKSQIMAFASAKGTELITLQRNLAQEGALRNVIAEQLSELKRLIHDQSIETEANNILDAIKEVAVANGKQQVDEVSMLLSELRDAAIAVRSNLIQTLKDKNVRILNLLDSWKNNERPVRDRIEAVRVDLLAKGVKLDMAHISKLTSDEARIKTEIDTLKQWVAHLKNLKSEYRTLLTRRWDVRRKIANARSAFAFKATAALREILDDLQVKLHYLESAFSPDAVNIICTAMNWRTTSQAKAKLLISKLSLPILIDAIYKENVSALLALTTPDGSKCFAEAEAREILFNLKDGDILSSLEQCTVHDIPILKVTKQIEDESGSRVISREFHKLSLGQQQSVLLALILSADSRRPLIIDQPEDNLDSQFIFHTFVPVLRWAKERRQVIVVTHNANIAVLGDAEQLIVFKSGSESSRIVARGSIDDAEARDCACEILEGAREAFTRRAAIYGVL